eukprot:445541_1
MSTDNLTAAIIFTILDLIIITISIIGIPCFVLIIFSMSSNGMVSSDSSGLKAIYYICIISCCSIAIPLIISIIFMWLINTGSYEINDDKIFWICAILPFSWSVFLLLIATFYYCCHYA